MNTLLLLFFRRLGIANTGLREVHQGWSEGQVLQQFVTSLPTEYGSTVDSLSVGLDTEVTRADVGADVRAKFARNTRNDMSVVTNAKDKGKGMRLAEKSALDRSRVTIVKPKDATRVSVPKKFQPL